MAAGAALVVLSASEMYFLLGDFDVAEDIARIQYGNGRRVQHFVALNPQVF